MRLRVAEDAFQVSRSALIFFGNAIMLVVCQPCMTMAKLRTIIANAIDRPKVAASSKVSLCKRSSSSYPMAQLFQMP